MKRVALVISALLVVALVWVVATRPDGGDSSTAVAGSVPVAGPGEELAASPTVPPPADAAAAAVAMTGDVVTAGLLARRDLIASFATADFGPELADATSEQLTDLQLSMTERGRSPARLSVAEFPLRAHTLSHDERSATIEVWSVLVIASPEEHVARQLWRTVTVDLQFVDGRWLVDGWKSAEGPTPAYAPEGAIASGREVADRLGWTELG